jgi:CheY-like chemotaxis protein
MLPILVVDDELPVRQLITLILVRDGFQVVEAEDGLSALSVLQKLNGELSLIISDVVMPRLDGISLCKKVKQEFPRIPVVLVSGNRPEASGVGDRFLEKPLYPDLLLRAVRALVGREPVSGSPVSESRSSL